MKHFKNVLKSTGIIFVITGFITAFRLFGMRTDIVEMFDTLLYFLGTFFMWKIVFKPLTKNILLQLVYIAVSFIACALMICLLFMPWIIIHSSTAAMYQLVDEFVIETFIK